jgi:hypothetical protein
MEDITFVLFLVVVIWLAVNWDDDSGGGRRMRVPIAGSA